MLLSPFGLIPLAVLLAAVPADDGRLPDPGAAELPPTVYCCDLEGHCVVAVDGEACSAVGLSDVSAPMFRIAAHWEQQCLGAQEDQVIVYSNFPETRQKVVVGDRHVAGFMLKKLNAAFCTGREVDVVSYTAGDLDHVQSWVALHRLDESDKFELSYRADQTATVDLADFLTECTAVAELQERDPNDNRPPLVLPEWGCAPDAGSEDGG